MITAREAQLKDVDAIVSIWLDKNAQASSCFCVPNALEVNPAMVAGFMVQWETWVLEIDGAVTAFGLWSKSKLDTIFIAIGAPDAESFYRLFYKCGVSGLAHGMAARWTHTRNADTDELRWVRALNCHVENAYMVADGRVTELKIDMDIEAAMAAMRNLVSDLQ